MVRLRVSVLPRRWRCGQSSNPHARKSRHGLAGWQGGGMQRRAKLSSAQRRDSAQLRLQAEMRLEIGVLD